MLSLIETIAPIVVGIGGGALLILGVIYEDILIAFESGLKEHIRKKAKKWKRRAMHLLDAVCTSVEK